MELFRNSIEKSEVYEQMSERNLSQKDSKKGAVSVFINLLFIDFGFGIHL
jgi:hypothetical protein